MATLAGRAYVSVEYDPKSIEKLRAQTKAHGESIGSSLGTAGRRAGHLLAVGIGVGAVAVGYGLGKAVQSAADFQKQLNILQAVSGATATQMKAIQAESIALGKDMKLPATSASDAAVAMTELAKGGLSVRDSMHAARGALELAVAGQTDVATAASITATSLNQFSLSGKEGVYVADLLANAANASAGNVTDFAEGLKYAGTSAHAAGQKIAVVVGALAEMANKGLAGSVAGSSLAQALRSLQAPSAKAQAEIKKFGLNIYDATGKMKPLDQISAIFTKQLGNMTQKTQNQTLATIFGSRAIQAARVVFLGGADALDKYTKRVSQTGGAQRLAAAQMKGFSGAIQGFTSNIETLGIQIGLVLLPPLTAAIGKLNDFVTVIGLVAAAPSVSVAIKIAWQGVGKVYDSLKAALFGEVTSLGTGGLKAGAAHGIQLPVQVDKKGLVPKLTAALGGAVAAVDWGAIGTTIGEAMGSAITFTSATAGKIVTSLTAAMAAHSNEIADAGAKIAAELIANLLDPAFWIKNWKTALAIGLTFIPVGDLLGIGGKLGKFVGEGLTKTFLRVASRLPTFLQRAIGAAVRIGEGLFAKLGDRAFAELQRALSHAPGLAQRFIGRAVSIGEAVFARLAAFISSKIGSAISTVGDKIQSSLIGRTVTWLGKFALIKAAISGIAAVFQTIIDAIKRVINWVTSLGTALANIHAPHISFPSPPGWLHLPHTGGIVTPTGMMFAGGGVASGGVMGRDSVPALLTPGEVVLNKDQQLALLHGGVGAPITVNVAISQDAIAGIARVEVLEGGKRTARTIQAGRKW